MPHFHQPEDPSSLFSQGHSYCSINGPGSFGLQMFFFNCLAVRLENFFLNPYVSVLYFEKQGTGGCFHYVNSTSDISYSGILVTSCYNINSVKEINFIFFLFLKAIYDITFFKWFIFCCYSLLVFLHANEFIYFSIFNCHWEPSMCQVFF